MSPLRLLPALLVLACAPSQLYSQTVEDYDYSTICGVSLGPAPSMAVPGDLDGPTADIRKMAIEGALDRLKTYGVRQNAEGDSQVRLTSIIATSVDTYASFTCTEGIYWYGWEDSVTDPCVWLSTLADDWVPGDVLVMLQSIEDESIVYGGGTSGVYEVKDPSKRAEKDLNTAYRYYPGDKDYCE